MADTTTSSSSVPSSPAPRRKRRLWLRVIVALVAVFIVLLVVGYFVGTSSAFLKSVILPKAGAALNAKITVSDASISPFSEVVLHNLQIATTGSEPLVTAPEVRLRYSLMDIIRGNIHVDEVSLSSPTIALVENPDNTSNLDPILKKFSENPSKPQSPSAKASQPPQIDIHKISVTEATFRQIKIYPNGNRDVASLSHVNLTANNLKNGQTAKLELDASISLQNNPPAPAAPGSLSATLNGSFSLALSADLKPSSIQGNTKFSVAKADGSLAQAATLGATLDCDVSPTDIKQVALRFAKGDTRLGELLVSGPFDMQKSEGSINIQLVNVDKNLLNLAGASSGLDFGPTTISSTNQIQLSSAGKSITAVGQFNLNQLQVTRTNETTPALDLHAGYNVTVDSAAGNAVIRSFTLTAVQKGAEIVHGELSSPMTFSWGNSANAVGDAALNLSVTHLDLANWKAFTGDAAPAGDVNLKLSLQSQEAGKQLAFDFSSEIDHLTAGSGSNQLSQVTVTCSLQGKAADLKQFNFPSYKLTVARQNQPLVTASGSGTYDQAANTADLQLDAQLMLAALLQALPRPDINVSSGTAALKVHVTQKDKNQNVAGDFNLVDFNGKVGSNSFQHFAATAALDVGLTPEQVQIRKIDGTISQNNKPGGSFNVTGTYGLSNQVAKITAKLTDFNQDGLRPFLEPALSGKQLTTVAINANASIQYDPQAASDIKAGLQVSNLVVHDPAGQFPSTPLAIGFQLDTSLNKMVADIRQCQVSLTPTDRATNQLQLTGHLDLSQSNAYTGNLKLAADSLDLTTYYDLFGGQQKTAANKPASSSAPSSSSSAPAASGPEQESPAKPLPFRNFTADASVGRLILHEVEITNFLMTAKIDGGHVVLNPFKLALNGAPVNTTVDLDLGVPGYKYDVSFGATAVPLAPLVNSFQPDRKGQLGGAFTANAKIAGTGTTGPNLKKYLTGQFDFGSTNLNLSVVNIRSPILKTLVNVIGIIPELTRNPAGAIGSLAGSIVPGAGAGKTGGLSGDLQKSPINQIAANGTIGSGKVDLQKALVQSAVFEADASGTVMLADILTNSAIQIPVTVALSRSLSDKFNLVPANADTNAPYVALPNFLTMKGTVGEPKSDINKVALAGTVFRGIGGMLNGVGAGTKAGSVIQGIGNVGNLLGGSRNPPNTTAATNAPPATNQSPVNSLLKGLFK